MQLKLYLASTKLYIQAQVNGAASKLKTNSHDQKPTNVAEEEEKKLGKKI